MALNYPDILQHNNPNLALVDATSLRGVAYPLGSLNDTGSIPQDKRKAGSIIMVTSSGAFYGFSSGDTGSWDVPANWIQLNGSTFDSSSFVTNDQTSSFVTISQTGSFITADQTGSFLTPADTGSFLVAADIADFVTANITASSVITGSVVNNTITFEKGDGSTFELVIDTGSAPLPIDTSSFVTNDQTSSFVTNSETSSFVTNDQTGSFLTPADTGSFLVADDIADLVTSDITASVLVTASYSGNTLTFDKGDGSSFDITINTGSVTDTDLTPLNQFSQSILDFTASYYQDSASFATNIDSLQTWSSSLEIPDITSLNQFSQSILQFTASYFTDSASFQSRIGTNESDINDLQTWSSSLVIPDAIDTSSFVTNDQTSSFVTNSQTSSFVTNSETASFLTPADTASFLTGDDTSSFIVRTGDTMSGDLHFGQANSIWMSGSNGQYLISTQDGNGRIQHKWNATRGTSETYLTSDPALSFDLDTSTPTDELIHLKYSPASSSGAPVSWQDILKIGTTTFNWNGNDFLTTDITASSVVTASYAGGVLTFEKGNGDTFGIEISGSGGGGGGLSMVWAEENASLDTGTNSGYQFSFGNGATNAEGLVIGYDCTIVGLTISTQTSTTGEVELYKNLAATGHTVGLSGSSTNTVTISEPISSGDRITFRTISGSGGTRVVVGAVLQTEGVVGPSGSSASTGSLVVTASAALNVLTFEKGDGSTFNVTIDTGSATTIDTSSFVTNDQTSSFVTNDQTASFVTNDQTSSFVTNDQTGSFITADQTSSFLTPDDTGSFLVSSDLIPLNEFSSSILSFTASYFNDSASISARVGDLENWSSSLEIPDLTPLNQFSQSILDFTSSYFTDSASFVTSNITGSSLVTASVSTNTITFTKGDGSTFPVTVDTGSGGVSVSGSPSASQFSAWTDSSTIEGTSNFTIGSGGIRYFPGGLETPSVPDSPETIAIYGDGRAYFKGRDVTNDIEFIMGTSVAGVAFIGSMTNHGLDIRINNSDAIQIDTSLNSTFLGDVIINSGENLNLGGNAVDDIFISSDPVSTVNDTLVSAGWIDTHYLRNADSSSFLTPADTASFLTEVVQDTTPQAGGDFELNGFNLEVSQSRINFTSGNYIDILDPGLGTEKLNIQGNLEVTIQAFNGVTLGGAIKIAAAANPRFVAPSGDYYFDFSATTTDRTVSWQDADGTVAFTSDIPDTGSFITNDDTGSFLTPADTASFLTAISDDTEPTLSADLEVGSNSLKFPNGGSISYSLGTLTVTGGSQTVSVQGDTSAQLVSDDLVRLAAPSLSLSLGGSGEARFHTNNLTAERVFEIPNLSGTVATTDITASSLVTASVSSNTLTFTKGNGDTFDLVIDTGSGGGGAPIDTSSFLIKTGDTMSGNLVMGGNDIDGIGQLESATGLFGTGVTNLRSFNVYGTGLDGRLSLQSNAGGNPGLEMTTDGNTSRVLLRLLEVGTDGTSLEIFTEPDGGSISKALTVNDDAILYIHPDGAGVTPTLDAGIRNNSGDIQWKDSSGAWSTFQTEFDLRLQASDTASLLTTGSVSGNTLTFTKGDGSTFDLTVDTGSGGGGGSGSQDLLDVMTVDPAVSTNISFGPLDITSTQPLIGADNSLFYRSANDYFGVGRRSSGRTVVVSTLQATDVNMDFEMYAERMFYQTQDTDASRNAGIDVNGTSNGFVGISADPNSDTFRWAQLRTANLTADRVFQFPDQAGTLALTSDIPDTSSFMTVLADDVNPVLSGSFIANENDIILSGSASTGPKLHWDGTYLELNGGFEPIRLAANSNFMTFTANSYASFANSYTSFQTIGAFDGVRVYADKTTAWRDLYWPDLNGEIATTNISASYMATASVSGNTITFEKGDGATFDLVVDTGSGGVAPRLIDVLDAGEDLSNRRILMDGHAVKTAGKPYLGTSFQIDGYHSTTPGTSGSYMGMGQRSGLSIATIYVTQSNNSSYSSYLQETEKVTLEILRDGGSLNQFIMTDTTAQFRGNIVVSSSIEFADGNTMSTTRLSTDSANSSNTQVPTTAYVEEYYVRNSETASFETRLKSITVESPTANEDITMLFTPEAITISQLQTVVSGSSPSLSWTLRHNSSRAAAGTEVITSGTSSTNTTTGDSYTTFNDATIPANSWVWLESTAASGVGEFHLTMVYTKD